MGYGDYPYGEQAYKDEDNLGLVVPGIISGEALGTPVVMREQVWIGPYIDYPRGTVLKQLTHYEGHWDGTAACGVLRWGIQEFTSAKWWSNAGGIPHWDNSEYRWVAPSSNIDNVHKTFRTERTELNDAFPLLEVGKTYSIVVWLTVINDLGVEWAHAMFTFQPIVKREDPTYGDIRLYHYVTVSDINMDETGLDVEMDAGLETAVLISLFTNRRANTDDILPNNSNDPGGWHGDVTMDIPIGSRLWLLSRAKTEREIPAIAEEYIREALKWMLDDNVARKIDVVCTREEKDILKMDIGIYRPEAEPVFYTYYYNWQAQALRENIDLTSIQQSLLGR